MKPLLDTHALLWWLTGDSRLSERAREVISREGAAVSVVSLWEITIKRALGKLEADVEVIAERVSGTDGFEWLDLRPPHVLELVSLPLHHGDPFDRMLIAQARAESATLVSRDAAFGRYEVQLDW